MDKSLKLNWHKSSNFGDQLNPYLVKKMWGFDSFKIKEGYKEPHVMMIGSILNEANSQTLVLGSGFVGENRFFEGAPKIITVRGKKTLQMVKDVGIETSEVGLGDPAILMPDYFTPNPGFNKYDIGIIPHIVDMELAEQIFGRKRGSRIIDLRLVGETFQEIESIINQICSCRCIISSSLHGLIIAHTYGIPGIWCEFSDMVIGGGFKFKDYMSAHGVEEVSVPYLDLKNPKSFLTIPEIKTLAKNVIVDSNHEREKMRAITSNVYDIIQSSKKMYLL